MALALGATERLRVSARFHVLGAGSAIPRAGYGPAGYALELEEGGPITLLDCGPGSIRTLPTVGLTVERVERVLITHEHTDHILDLFALAFARRNPTVASIAPELELVGPVGLRALVERAPDVLGRWVQFERTQVHEVVPDKHGCGAFHTPNFEARFATTGHTPTALAWRVEVPGIGGVVFSGDTPLEPRVAQLARGAALLVLECSFPDGAGTANHLTPSQAAELVRQAQPAQVLLSHFYPETDPEACAEQVRDETEIPVLAAYDGMTLKLT